MKNRQIKKRHEINTLVDFEYEITFDDVIDIIASCDYNEKSKIRNIIGNDYDDIDFDEVYSIVNNFTFNTEEREEIKKIINDEVKISLYDDLKNRLMKVAFEKYDLEELQKRLEIKNY